MTDRYTKNQAVKDQFVDWSAEAVYRSADWINLQSIYRSDRSADSSAEDQSAD